MKDYIIDILTPERPRRTGKIIFAIATVLYLSATVVGIVKAITVPSDIAPVTANKMAVSLAVDAIAAFLATLGNIGGLTYMVRREKRWLTGALLLCVISEVLCATTLAWNRAMTIPAGLTTFAAIAIFAYAETVNEDTEPTGDSKETDRKDYLLFWIPFGLMAVLNVIAGCSEVSMKDAFGESVMRVATSYLIYSPWMYATASSRYKDEEITRRQYKKNARRERKRAERAMLKSSLASRRHRQNLTKGRKLPRHKK